MKTVTVTKKQLTELENEILRLLEVMRTEYQCATNPTTPEEMTWVIMDKIKKMLEEKK